MNELQTTDALPEELELDGSVDPHFHGRDLRRDGDGRMESVIESAIGEHEVLVLIGNSNPPILTQKDADAYVDKARQCIPPKDGGSIDLYAAPLLTDATTPDMVYEMRQKSPRNVALLKGFLSHVSNDAGYSVSNVWKLEPTLHACHDNAVDAPPIPVHWHMERKFDRHAQIIEMRDREWFAIEHDFADVLEIDPEGSHTVKHVSDKRTIARIDEYRKGGYDVWLEFSPHYFERNHEDLYRGPGGVGTALNAHEVCWPIYKSRSSQDALIAAALSGKSHYFFGSDCALHIDDPTRAGGVKITSDGIVCGGLAILPAVSKSIVIDLFARNGKEHLLNEFLSANARRALHLPPARTTVRYRREPWRVPGTLTGTGPRGPIKIRPFMKGEIMEWKRVP
jgi:dihydroorotase